MPLSATLSASTQLTTSAPVPALPPVSRASFGIGDSLFLVVMALIVFGPKKLPEISRQLGKLMFEFRKASNDFKFQIEEELRASEQAERQKQLQAQAATPQPATPVAMTVEETVSAEPTVAVQAEPIPLHPETAATQPAVSAAEPTILPPTIQPPATGLPVSTASPYRAVEPEPPVAAASGTASASPSASSTAAQTEAFDEMQANAQEAVRSAAADPSYNTAGDAVPTHHG